MRVAVSAGLVLSLSLFMSGCAHMPADDPADPLERVNRGVYKFNRVADTYVLRPVAKSYKTYVPDPIREGFSNFFDNLFYPTTIVNDILQFKPVQTGKDLGRFVLNTTVGLVGFLDVATQVGLPRNDEDLGQTFGHWGVGEGWYLMLPLLGPSTNRDALGAIGDTFTSPTGYVDTYPALAINGGKAIDARAGLLDADKYLDDQLDSYIFIRTAYLQNRLFKVHDGNPPKEKFSFDEE
ncbi:MAG: MlaA family lipoprotein [Panacagrimonas sp.]